jgi:hypothetical protein
METDRIVKECARVAATVFDYLTSNVVRRRVAYLGPDR